jgi:putative transposase
MSQEYRHFNTSVTLINYHFVWIPRRRRPVLCGKIANRLKELLYEKSKKLDIEIIALEIMPDHVHLFVNCTPLLAPSQIMFRLKGYSARVLRKEYPEPMRLPSMWTTSFFCSTAGNVSSTTVQRYIEQQSKI